MSDLFTSNKVIANLANYIRDNPGMRNKKRIIPGVGRMQASCDFEVLYNNSNPKYILLHVEKEQVKDKTTGEVEEKDKERPLLLFALWTLSMMVTTPISRIKLKCTGWSKKMSCVAKAARKLMECQTMQTLIQKL
jgi:hypothetical protein